MYPFLNNNIIISDKCQAKIKRLQERVIFKEKLLKPVKTIFDSKTYKTQANDKMKRFSDCGKFLTLDPITGEILQANFCKMRICPVCNYIKSSINFYKIRDCVQYIKSKYNSEFIFMTLTIKNCSGEELSKTIDHILQSFNRLRNRKTWKKSVQGLIRGLEITYNKENNTFHPHIHMLVAVPEDYFSSENEKYITIEKLRNWWSESAKLDYFVQVDIRKVEKSDNAIAEVAKYSIKMAEILNAKSDETQIQATETIFNCTYGRRLIGTSGIFKEAMKQLKISDMNDFNIESLRKNHEITIDLIWENNTYKEL